MADSLLCTRPRAPNGLSNERLVFGLYYFGDFYCSLDTRGGGLRRFQLYVNSVTG